MQSTEALAPDLARFVIEFAYGDIYTRPGLLPNSANYASTPPPTLGNRERQLRDHIQQALYGGCTPKEVAGVILMMAVYAGFPAAINGMEICVSFCSVSHPQIDTIRCN